ncbi:Botcinic acid biosynthesis cluster B 16 [Hyphodiscus hymeniophilus]|uniref:Botcinic acid biosynthesis cluster B 16 n=1 Tax=Hyphodiscus hymeniophilus TaxID=353542 RepID=A0A9P6VQU3_9HELO|nr:Botcinic acid biosynthesis cluster B 16 [Hyphodiscus hymeniophilus]
MHLILTGATGLVGSGVLRHMIETPSISKVSVLSRRPVPQAEGHEKVHVIIQPDFNTYTSEILAQIKDAEGCVWAQGISVTQVTKEEYLKITYDYPLAAAKAFAALPDPPKPFKFVYVSGEGATTSPGMFTAHFGVIKGRTEAALLALSKESPYANLRPYSLRPAGVDPTLHTEIQEWIAPAQGYLKAFRALSPAFRALTPSLISPTKDLARVLTDLAMGNGEPLEGKGVEGEGRTISNVGMRRLAGI